MNSIRFRKNIFWVFRAGGMAFVAKSSLLSQKYLKFIYIWEFKSREESERIRIKGIPLGKGGKERDIQLWSQFTSDATHEKLRAVY
jgi:hypothetical protein